MLKKISTEKAPAAIGPYSQAVVCGNIIYTSGQLGMNPENAELEGTTVTEQATQALKNLGAILEQAGTSYDKIIKTTCFLADMADFAEFNRVYSQFITSAPARSCVAVKTLPKNALVEIEAIAEIG